MSFSHEKLITLNELTHITPKSDADILGRRIVARLKSNDEGQFNQAIDDIKTAFIQYLFAWANKNNFPEIRKQCEVNPILQAEWVRRLKLFEHPSFEIQSTVFSHLQGAFLWDLYLKNKKLYSDDKCFENYTEISITDIYHLPDEAVNLLNQSCDFGTFLALVERLNISHAIVNAFNESSYITNDRVQSAVKQIKEDASALAAQYPGIGHLMSAMIFLDSAAYALNDQTERKKLEEFAQNDALPESIKDCPEYLRLLVRAVTHFCLGYLLKDHPQSQEIAALYFSGDLTTAFPSEHADWDSFRKWFLESISPTFKIPHAEDWINQIYCLSEQIAQDIKSKDPLFENEMKREYRNGL
ncbi:MAG: hypothetical protein SFW66_09885 [Gammaproteobacteria bacterium]|nr:hypothetical protein [Gammaproteobacteria bacterium]